jgi:aspartate/methionine/tyrosine aminotransferase
MIWLGSTESDPGHPQLRGGVLRLRHDHHVPLFSAAGPERLCAPTPLQHVVAWAIDELPPQYYDDSRYSHKRRVLCEALETAGFCRAVGRLLLLADIRKKFPNLTLGKQPWIAKR